MKDLALTLNGKIVWGMDPWFTEIRNGRVRGPNSVDSGRTVSLKEHLEKLDDQINRFQVWIDGRRIVLSAKWLDDLLDPNLEVDLESGCLFAWLSKDGSMLTVKMLGSDGAGGYRVIWRIKKTDKRRDGSKVRHRP